MRLEVLVAAGILTWATALQAQDDKKKDDLKNMVVQIDGLKSEAPKEWKREKPNNLLRFYQFRLPKVEGDPEDADLGISAAIGKEEANIDRAKKSFLPPEDKKIEDVIKVEKMKVGVAPVTYIDVQGTYLKKKQPIDPDSKAEKKPSYRMLRVLFETRDDLYVISLVGPAKTVERHKKAFDDWLKAFK